MSLVRLRSQQKIYIAPTCISRRHFREQNRVPLNRRQLIKKIAEDTLGKTITKSSCFLLPPEPFSLKKLSLSRTPETSRSYKLDLKFGEFKASDIKSINTVETLRKSLAKKKLRSSTEEKSREETNKDINSIKSMIDRLVLNNRNKTKRPKFDSKSIEMPVCNPERRESTTNVMKETQQYYNIKKYYEERYSSC